MPENVIELACSSQSTMELLSRFFVACLIVPTILIGTEAVRGEALFILFIEYFDFID